MAAVTRVSRRLPPLVSMVLAGVLVAGGVPGQPAPRADASAGAPYRVNLASTRDYVQQTNFVQCVGTSVQMMLNIIRPGSDRTSRTQKRLQGLARAWSGPTPPGFERQGASVRGWAASLVIHRAGAYKVVGADSLQDAMRIAATAIREYRRPVGLLVWRGRHAWVMSGFVATGDPLLAETWKVTKAYILDPLYPYGDDTWGPSPKPGTAISVAAVGRQFVRRQSSRSSAWNQLPGQSRLRGKYVLVVPTGQIRPGIE
jgi:hypothetical protein